MSHSPTSTPIAHLPSLSNQPSDSPFRRQPRPESASYGLVRDSPAHDHDHGPPILLVPLADGTTRNYADGGIVGQDEGDLGVAGRGDEHARRKINKGKGRSDAVADDSVEFPPPTGDDEERESKRVADNLAQWSRVEKQRRQQHRKSSTLVLPNAPISGATLSTLSRRSSALIFRSPSARKPTEGLSSVEAPTSPSMTASPNAGEGRRAARRSSARLPERGESGGSTVALGTTLEGTEEGDDDEEGGYGEEEKHDFDVTPPSLVASPPPPDHPVHRSSRFIEHLPHSPASPTRPSHSHTPSIPSTSTARTSLSLSSDGGEPSTPSSADFLSNPFSEVLAPIPFSSPRPGPPINRDSDLSIHTVDTIRPRRSLESTRGLVTGERDSARQPRRMPRQWAHDEDDEDEEEQDDVGGIGVLDWLLCGCWKNLGDGDEGDGEQRGRTNPNE